MNEHGFTLIEVLVALTILAVALAAAARATGIATDGALELRERMLATWVAENRLASYAASNAFPDLGDHNGEEEQAGLVFRWQETITGMANPRLRRVEVKVFSPRGNEYVVSQLSTYVYRKR